MFSLHRRSEGQRSGLRTDWPGLSQGTQLRQGGCRLWCLHAPFLASLQASCQQPGVVWLQRLHSLPMSSSKEAGLRHLCTPRAPWVLRGAKTESTQDAPGTLRLFLEHLHLRQCTPTPAAGSTCLGDAADWQAQSFLGKLSPQTASAHQLRCPDLGALEEQGGCVLGDGTFRK